MVILIGVLLGLGCKNMFWPSSTGPVRVNGFLETCIAIVGIVILKMQ